MTGNISINLIVCLAGLLLWIVDFIIMQCKISTQKKKLTAAGKEIPKAETAYNASLSLTVLVELLPVLIPLSFTTETIACVCGVLGSYIVLAERLQKLKKAEDAQ
ncbi:MAG: hypothetical protein KBS64_03935 [Treponema sp.]|nr:hypothetical protein [Candidatus Treponema equi]